MSSLRGKKVLITGSTGFIGANLMRKAISAGADVSILTRKSSDVWRIQDKLGDVSQYQLDLSDYECLESVILKIEPEIIYHTAAYGGNPFHNDFRKIIESNYIGTANLVNACRKVDLELFVNTGSSSEYGIKTSPMREEDILEPVNDYGVSKSAATLYCQSLARNKNIPMVTLRLFSPYGYYEGHKRLIPSVILDCFRGENPKIISKAFVRDFIFIEDVINAYIKVLDAKEIVGEIINIGSGKQHTVGDIANTIIELAGEGLAPETGGTPRWSNEPEKWEADITKAKKLLNWEPKYDLTRGLDTTIKWFRENINLYKNYGEEL
jgi:nucleoside-diphosphate-sugar epimerase